MFHEFLTLNRIELIERCRRKVARRTMPSEVRSGTDHGVPLFLQQLIDTLLLEQSTTRREGVEAEIAPSPTEIGRAAALHGNELQRRGYSVGQVVHEYGDICQSVSDLAIERNVVVSADEFRTLNRCLDNAIADAVTAFGSTHHGTINLETTQHHNLETIFVEHKRLVDTAAQAFLAIRTGAVGPNGTTGILLTRALNDLRSLAERALREISV
jgi:hypothetical protein